MKKISILFLSVLTLGTVLSSCSNDIGEVSNADNNGVSVIGKWEYSKTGVSVNGQEHLNNYVTNPCGKNYIEFLPDGTFRVFFYISAGSDKCTLSNRYGNYKMEGLTFSMKKETSEDIVNFEILMLDTYTLKIKSHSETLIFKKI